MKKQMQPAELKVSMIVIRVLLAMLTAIATLGWAQTPIANSVVPTLVNFSGNLTDVNNKPLAALTGVTFYLYKDAEGGTPLWIENQNVQPDKFGHYSVVLGTTASQGLPSNLFASGEARWLGVQAQGQAEQPRVMLLAVPYALKAGDAQTVGGLPASAFVLAAPGTANTSNGDGTTSAGSDVNAAAVVSGSGTTDFIPLWTNNSLLGNSVLFQAGSGSTAEVGINTTTPAATLDVNGGMISRGALELPTTGVATASKGFDSQPLLLQGSSFNSSTMKAIGPLFQWQTEPTGNNTSSPAGTLNLLYGNGSGSPAETGLSVGSSGKITFASGQTFPGAGTITGVTTANGSGLTGGGTSGTLNLALTNTCAANQVLQWNGSAWACVTLSGGGTITGVTAGTDLTGGGTNGNVTLNLDTTKVPQLNVNNTFTGNESVTGNVTASGTISGGLGSFAGNSGSTILNVTQNATSGSGFGIVGTSFNNNHGQAAVLGQEMAASSQGVYGVYGFIGSSTGAGVYGQDNSPQTSIGASITGGIGVWGDSGGGTIGVLGTTTGFNAVVGFNSSASFGAVVGENEDKSGSGISPGVAGISLNTTGIGTLGAGPVFSHNFNGGAGAQTIGVVGDTATAGGIGVWGSSDNGTSVFGSTGDGTGVYGLAPHGTAVYGLSSGGTGVYGETDAGVGDVGVFGYAATDPDIAVLGETADGYGVEGIGNNQFGGFPGYFEQEDTNDPVNLAFSAGGPGTGFCNVDIVGNLYCTGDKSAMVPLPDKRWVRLYAVESPENWFEDFGSGTLEHGRTSVALESTFRETVTSSQDYHVFLTPKGDCKGLFVTGETANGFEVHELGGGQSDIAFDYRIVVRRKGYENIRLEDATKVYERNVAAVERTKKVLSLRKNAPIPGADHRPSSPIQMPVAPRQTMPLHANSLPVASVAQAAMATKP